MFRSNGKSLNILLIAPKLRNLKKKMLFKTVVPKIMNSPSFLLAVLIAKILFVLSAFYIYYNLSKDPWLSIDKWSQGSESISEVYRNIALVIVASMGMLVGIYRGLVASRANKIAHNAQVASVYLNALEQFSVAKLQSVRIGTIHTLGRIAKDNPKDYKVNVTHVLTSYIRLEAKLDQQFPSSKLPDRDHMVVREDVLAAMNYIAFNNVRDIDLPNTNLSLLSIPHSKLINFNLSFSEVFYANLQGADISGTRLYKTYFYQTSMNGAILKCPYIRRARFTATSLNKANFNDSVIFKTLFHSCQLKNASLRGVHFNRSNFERCDLTGADFRNSTFRGGLFTFSTLKNADFRNTTNPPLNGLAKAKNIEGLKLDDDKVDEFKRLRIEYKRIKNRNYVDDEDPSIPRID